ncbi:hypothetical protein FQN53_005953 [Emmonsiellopsis sp. PD_33]|nr:hypothetical protein FQN53_005953 [Emmonsiellopsis sp. PD_33]
MEFDLEPDPLPSGQDSPASRADEINTNVGNSAITAEFERTSPRVKEQRQRILISHQYEKKIEAIDHRLAGIEQMIRDLAVNKNKSPLAEQQQPFTPNPGANNDTGSEERGHHHQREQQTLPSHSSTDPVTSGTAQSSPKFEGEPSLSAVSVHTSEQFEKAVGDSPAAEHDPEMRGALSALKELVQRHNMPSPIHTLRFAGQKPSAKVDLSKLELPPVNAVLALLRSAKEHLPVFILTIPFLDIPTITQLCKDLYFCTEEYSIALFAIVNCVLSYLFEECGCIASNHDPSLAASFRDYFLMCRRNFETAVNCFDLFMEPSCENIMALALGAFHATEMSKPSLCWTFVSAASRMCQSLGYHHSVSTPTNPLPPDEANRRKSLFWFIYVLDKDLTLSLGRSSTIPDYDVSLPLPGPPADPKAVPWHEMWAGWVGFSKVVSQIYEKLYSVRALAEDPATRGRKAFELAEEITRWWEGFRTIHPKSGHHPEFFRYITGTVDLSYYSILTLIYRAKPPIRNPIATASKAAPAETVTTSKRATYTLDPACVDAAREALRLHQHFALEFSGQGELWRGYVIWVLLQCPFTPFLVIFSHAIATASTDDLQLLSDVSSSLEAAANVSLGADRLYKLCAVFYQVAKLYIDIKLREGEAGDGGGAGGWEADGDQAMGTEVDNYLWALGFGAPGGGIGTEGTEAAGTGTGHAQMDNVPGAEAAGEMSPTLQDWFRGNMYMMGLLESDL